MLKAVYCASICVTGLPYVPGAMGKIWEGDQNPLQPLKLHAQNMGSFAIAKKV